MANIVSRLSAAFDGFMSGWMSPGDSLKPQAPANTPPRQMQYPTGYNMRNTPRQDEPISFAQLRAIADSYDLLRLAIETRKDQIETLKWTIVSTKPDDQSRRTKKDIERITDLIKRPDRHLSFNRWIRSITEDVLVIDAPAIYIRRTKGGEIYSFDLVDGATIKRNLDETGRTPLPPDPAYQQILYGAPAVDLTTDELLYMPRNQRTNKVYGLGNVEQVIMSVNIALRRQLYQLGFYTEGTVPEAFLIAPSDWGPDQIAQFQEYWDALFENAPDIRHKTRLVPHGAAPVFPKANILKDEYDEWLARIISYCFSLPPTALVKETNRATAQTTQEAGKAEGLAPLANYLKELMDILIQVYAQCPHLEFSWKEEESQDPLKQAQVNQIYLAAGVLTTDEVRQELGRDPLPEEYREQTDKTAAQEKNPLPSTKEGESEEPEGGERDVVKSDTPAVDNRKKKVLAPLDIDTPELMRWEEELIAAVTAAFDKIKPDFTEQVADKFEAATSGMAKLDREQIILLEMILDELDYDGWGILFDHVKPILTEVAAYGAYRALLQVGIDDKDITKLANKIAIAWAKDRAAELVGMKFDGEKMSPHPNPKWAITESTREYLRGTVVQALEEGWSPQKLANAIIDKPSIWKRRAEMIARTELAFAHSEGNFIGWEKSGVVEAKESILGDYDACDLCQGNANAGVIDLKEKFPSGHTVTPYHPHCRCAVVPLVAEWEDVAKFEESRINRGKDGKFKAKSKLHRVPKEGTPSSHYTLQYENGKIKSRRFYDSAGKATLDIHNSDHGHPKHHPTVPHAHGWENGIMNKQARDLTPSERKQNHDMFGGEGHE